MFGRFKKKTAVFPPTRPVVSYKPGFALDYFRSRQDLVDYVRELLREPEFQDVLSVLHHELPLASTIEAVQAHKRVLRMLELMGESPQQPSQEIQPTFGAEKEFPELLTEIDENQ